MGQKQEPYQRRTIDGPWQRVILCIQLAKKQPKLALKAFTIGRGKKKKKKYSSELGYRFLPTGVTVIPMLPN